MMATSLKQLKRVIADFQKAQQCKGVEIHPDKTKTITNQKENTLKEIEIDGMRVDVLSLEGKISIWDW